MFEDDGFSPSKALASVKKLVEQDKVFMMLGLSGSNPTVGTVEYSREAKVPIFHTIVGGGMEHLLLGGTSREASLLEHLQRSFASIRDRLREMTRFGIPRMPGDFVSLLLFAMPGILIAQAADIRVAGIVAFGVAAVSMIGSGLTPVSFLLLPAAARLLAAGTRGSARRRRPRRQ